MWVKGFISVFSCTLFLSGCCHTKTKQSQNGAFETTSVLTQSRLLGSAEVAQPSEGNIWLGEQGQEKVVIDIAGFGRGYEGFLFSVNFSDKELDSQGLLQNGQTLTIRGPVGSGNIQQMSVQLNGANGQVITFKKKAEVNHACPSVICSVLETSSPNTQKFELSVNTGTVIVKNIAVVGMQTLN